MIKKTKTNSTKKYLPLLLFSITIIASIYLGNNWIQITTYNITSSKLPNDFHDFKILQISDLHNKKFGKDNNILTNNIKKIKPDIILITGDLIDYKKSDINIAIKLISQIKEIAPIYFVNGNHEWWSGKAKKLENKLIEENVTILNNKIISISRGKSEIVLIGVDDPEGFSSHNEYINKLKELSNEKFSILLSHRAEDFALYVKNNYDIVFAGHAHGGQIRIPFIGGLVSPNQGFFPEFTSGIHEKGNTRMIISRGLGNSIIPVRIFNRPELVVVNIRTDIR
ncbi:MAG: metallophosphoesterase [Candidatus Cloacimonetes bacterium]|nr:metallophosphoesterase [Candidatus Cloacimonadota bacterium]